MADGFASKIDHERLRSELVNWLKLAALSGTKEIILPETSAAGRDAPRVMISAEGADQPRPQKRMGAELRQLRLQAEACTACELRNTRTKVVFGDGDAEADLVFVGEGPGAEEDAQGKPFVGRAGMLLTKIIQAMGIERGEVYITNVVKCRPPGNRVPEPDEIFACMPYLERQVDLIHPRVICALGAVATQTLTGTRRGVSEMRGRIYDYRGMKVIPTYHPAACLRNPDSKRLVWEDIKKVMQELGLPVRGVMRNGTGENRG